MGNNYKRIPVVFLLLLLPEFLCAQCCSAGNPFFYSRQTTLEKQILQLGVGYKYGDMENYYHGHQKIDIDDIRRSWFNYLNFDVLYGLTHRLSLRADLGYYINKNEDYYKADWVQKTGHGPGDLEISARYLAYKNHIRKLTVLPSMGIKLPIGVFDQEIDHVKLPISLQPSSGSYKYLTSIYLTKGFKNQKFNLGGSGSFEYAQWIHSENFDYKYGNLLMFSLIFLYEITPHLTLGLETRNENRSKSLRDHDYVIQSTGYSLVYVIPHLSYSFFDNWVMSVNSEIPFFRYYSGIQLGNRTAFSARISRSLDFIARKSKLVDSID